MGSHCGRLRFSIVVVLWAITRTAAAQNYIITDLGDLGGGYAVAHDVNASGQVVGQSLTSAPAEFQAFIWLPSPAYGLPAGMYSLETLGGTYSGALGINASGQVVGQASVAGDTAYHAVLWPADGGVIDLGTLGGRNSQAFDINDAGEVVGWSDTAANTRHAFSWRDTNGNGAADPGEMVDLGHLGGGQSFAYGINASGQIVGNSTTDTFASHAFRTSADGVIDPAADLGTLGGLSSTAYRINGAGQVVGHSQIFGNTANHAFRTAANSAIDPNTSGLGSLGGTRSEAWGINAGGQAVGWSYVSGSTARRAFFSSGNGMVDLNTFIDPALGWRLDAAYAISDSGQIVGSGSSPAGTSRAFLLRPQLPLAQVSVGLNVTVQPTDLQGTLQPLTVIFTQVTQAGVITAAPLSSIPALPAGFLFRGIAYDIHTTAQYSLPVTICFTGVFTALDSLLHYQAGVWLDVTTSRTATQICGRTATLSPFAVATANQAPSLALPAHITQEAASAAGAAVSYSATASDPEDGALTAVCTPVSGATFPLGTTTVGCSATDSVGARTNGSFTIAVRDTTAPVVAPPAAITIPTTEAGGARGSAWPALATFLAGGSGLDLVDPAPSRLEPQVGGVDVDDSTLFAIGTTTTVTFRFRDASGNIGTASSTVTVAAGAPRISVRIAAHGTVSGHRKFVDLEVSNSGAGPARDVALAMVVLVPTKGFGMPKLVSPKLPRVIGNLDAGSSAAVRVVFDVPASVKELAIIETGTFRNVKGRLGAFFEIQRVAP
jgi:probable HAF family extracellular repeat protein